MSNATSGHSVGDETLARVGVEPDARAVEVAAPVPSPASGITADVSHEVAIRVRNLSKMYKLYAKPSMIVKELLLRKPMHSPIWALKDTSFDVRRGEIVGVVGANGAGKSTLLQIIAGVLDATDGTFDVKGQLRAILQLGTGFHLQYTGRENIYMGGYCLGYTKEEIDESFEWIVDFSGLRSVIDQPFRTYSSGMRSRLTFSVTFCRRPDILIVDEALATGDRAFQQRCVNRIIDLCSGGSTALVVSHSMYFIETLCHRAIYLRGGELVADGPCRGVTKMYERDLLEEFAQEDGEMPDVDPTSMFAGRDEPPRTTSTTATVAKIAPTPSTSTDVDEDDPTYPDVSPEIQALLDDPEGACPAIKHLELVRLVECRVLDAHGQACDQFHTGDSVTFEIEVDSKVSKDNIAIGIQLFNDANIHVSTTTNLVHLDEQGKPQHAALHLRKGRQVFRVHFPALFLCDGRYHIGVGMSPKERHFSESDQLMREWRVAVFGFYRADTPWKQIYDPPSEWSKRKA